MIRKHPPVLLIAAALVLCGALPAHAIEERSSPRSKLDLALQDLDPTADRMVQVIVRTREGARDRVRARLEARGFRIKREHRIVNAITARVPVAKLAAIAADPRVESISLDAVVSGHATKDSPATDSSLSFLRKIVGIGSFVAGSSVTIAVLDSGIQPSDDFAGRLVGQYDVIDGQPAAAVQPYDDHGHGTHVAGLIGSSGVLSGGRYAGVAIGSKLVAYKVLTKNGKGRTSDVIAALEHLVRTKDSSGVKVVNLSLGHPIYEPASRDPLVLAVERATRAGLIVVTAAGNYGTDPRTGVTGYAGIASPGNAPSAITVGASNPMGTAAPHDDQVTRYSSRGPTWYDGVAKPDIVAPGQGLVSDAPDGATLTASLTDLVVLDSASRSKFLKLSGSSMAAAVVSGLVALMIDVNRMGVEQRARQLYGGRYMNRYWVRPPDLSANAIKVALQYTAFRLTDPATAMPYDRLAQGSGAVNGVGSLYTAYLLDQTVAPGEFWLSSPLTPETTIEQVTLPWSQEVAWGRTLLTGSALLEVRQSAWDDNIVWGTADDNLVWGTLVDDNIVWGTSIGDGDNIVWGTGIFEGDNIVWGGSADWTDNIVWGTTLLGTFDGDNIVWGTMGGDNLVWGTLANDNIVWGTDSRVFVQLVTEGGL